MQSHVDTIFKGFSRLTSRPWKKTLLHQQIGTIQFLLLTAIFAIPRLSGFHLPLFSIDNLAEILAIELGVLIYGFYLAGFLFLPTAIIRGVWVRRICFLLACLLAVPLTSSYWREYGFYGFLNFCALLFANFSSVFIASMSFKERTKLALEAGSRCIVYVAIFMAVAVGLDMPVNIESWSGNKVLSFGSIYFGVLTFIERQRYFSKMTELTFHLLKGTLVRAPKSRIRYVSGRIKAHVLSKNDVQRGFLLFFTGSAVSAISLVMLYATFNVESSFGTAALWVFFVPFLIIGVSSAFSGIAFRLIAWRKGHSLLRLQQQALQDDNKLYVVGNIPKYSKRERRTGFSVQLIHYRVDSMAGEEFVVSVKTLLNEKMTNKHLTYQTTDRGTEFRVEYPLPPSSKLIEDSSGFDVWHLQAKMNEAVETEDAKKRHYSWVVAFPLPLAATPA